MQSLHRSARQDGGFTLVELLTVMAIIAILAGLILSISGYAAKKGALSRAQSEIQAISAACESYKADNGTYPYEALAVSGSIPTSGTIPSDYLDPRTMGNSSSSNANYASSSLELYQALTGDLSCSGTGGGAGVKNYIADMRPDVWGRGNMSAPVSGTNLVTYISDPFGQSYGYSTANSTAVTTGSSYVSGYSPPTSMPGYNPTFDLWSTAGLNTTPNSTATAGQPGDPALAWVKNW